jgi:hypothetical protein
MMKKNEGQNHSFTFFFLSSEFCIIVCSIKYTNNLYSLYIPPLFSLLLFLPSSSFLFIYSLFIGFIPNIKINKI